MNPPFPRPPGPGITKTTAGAAENGVPAVVFHPSPPQAQELVKEWLKDNYKSLGQMWDTQIITKLNPLK
mgnify:CR=1 FL=1